MSQAEKGDGDSRKLEALPHGLHPPLSSPTPGLP